MTMCVSKSVCVSCVFFSFFFFSFLASFFCHLWLDLVVFFDEIVYECKFGWWGDGNALGGI